MKPNHIKKPKQKNPNSFLEVRRTWNKLPIQIMSSVGLLVGLSSYKKPTKKKVESKDVFGEKTEELKLIGSLFDKIVKETDRAVHIFPTIAKLDTPKKPGHDRALFLSEIDNFFNKDENQSVIICLSGRGQWDATFTEVVFYFDETEKGEDKYLRVGHVLQKWSDRKNKLTCKQLVLILDFNFSGFWADQVRRLEFTDVSVQSSSKPEQECKRLNKYIGLFMNNWLFANNSPSIQWVNPLKAYAIKAEQINEIQTPIFYGNQLACEKLAGLKVGFNSWETMFKDATRVVSNGCYIGQTFYFQDPDTEIWSRKAHGRGATFNDNMQFLEFGTWKEGILVEKEPAEMLKGEYTENETINLKIDYHGNLLIGFFYAYELDNKGEIVTHTGNYWKGEFQDGSICGSGTWTYIDGWKIEGVRDFDEFIDIKRVLNAEGEDRPGFVLKTPDFTGKKKKVVDGHGNLFIGNFEKGELVGKGKWKSPHGFFTEAEFEKGFVVSVSEVLDYKGEPTDSDIYDEESNGFGIYIIEDYGFFEGVLTKGVKNDRGIWLSGNGGVYKGKFQKNLLHGKGKFFCENGDLYEQDWKAGVMATQVAQHIDPNTKQNNSSEDLESEQKASVHEEKKIFVETPW